MCHFLKWFLTELLKTLNIYRILFTNTCSSCNMRIFMSSKQLFVFKPYIERKRHVPSSHSNQGKGLILNLHKSTCFNITLHFFYIDIQNVLELLGVTRGSISITLGRQILVTKSCSLFTMHLMQIYVIFFFTQRWYLWLLVFEKNKCVVSKISYVWIKINSTFMSWWQTILDLFKG